MLSRLSSSLPRVGSIYIGRSRGFFALRRLAVVIPDMPVPLHTAVGKNTRVHTRGELRFLLEQMFQAECRKETILCANGPYIHQYKLYRKPLLLYHTNGTPAPIVARYYKHVCKKKQKGKPGQFPVNLAYHAVITVGQHLKDPTIMTYPDFSLAHMAHSPRRIILQQQRIGTDSVDPAHILVVVGVLEEVVKHNFEPKDNL